jgi:hypothetical protein
MARRTQFLRRTPTLANARTAANSLLHRPKATRNNAKRLTGETPVRQSGYFGMIGPSDHVNHKHARRRGEYQPRGRTVVHGRNDLRDM